MDIASARAVGIAATPLPFADVYSATKQGVVEGLLIPRLLGYGMRFHEVAPYITKSFHQQSFTLVWFCNKKWLDSIPDDLKKIFLASVQEAAAWQIQNTYEQDVKADELLTKEGATIAEFTPEAEAPMIAASKKVWAEYKGEIPAEYFEEIEKAKGEYRKKK
jgi:TRAP-type C4-dicarboxylate transport system substrate-binding protein